MFKKVKPWIDFVKLEHEIISFWESNNTFETLRTKNKDGQVWSFLDGPITANNPMGVHHAWGRTLKDTYQRYHSMKGEKLRYQNGFDCQGLWVEVEVEKQLGFKSKKDIEGFGIENFVNLCKERVYKYSEIITEQSKRLGYWMDWDNSYFTMSDNNNYTIWKFLKKCHDRGLVYHDFDVMPWCPRCGTGLSQHEVGEGYKEVTHTSVFVKFPIMDHPDEYLLIWTTTPWTLCSNVAVAVNPDTAYVKAKQADNVFILAKNLADKILKTKGPFEIVSEFLGKDLLGLKYVGPYDELPAQGTAKQQHSVIAWKDVSDDDGTGLVHIAPGCGKEDFELGKQNDLCAISPINEDGVFLSDFGFLTNKFAGGIADEIVADLKQKNILYSREKFKHSYPHCWRCGTELLFRLVDEWFVSMDEWRAEIIEVAKQINWIPSYGKDLELDWLKNMNDWMISKKRYWGLALPIWVCENKICRNFEVLGSKEELEAKAVSGWDAFEGHSPHRPWIDNVTIKCQKCGGTSKRIPDVGNPWLDAGIVPYSTMKYGDDKAYFRDWFPADLVLECFPGQFKNWFYSLLAMSTMMENKAPFKTLLGHALVRDENGQEMHKSSGNAIWFDEAAEKIGVDVMRWIYCGQDPTINLNFGFNIAKEIRGGVFNTYWNAYSFFCNLASACDFVPNANFVPNNDRPNIDKWILAKLSTYIKAATRGYEDCDAKSVVKGAEDFLENLSNWYIRLCRRRFWGDPKTDIDATSAFQTLYECLDGLSRVMAPMTPFMAEAIYQNLVRSHDTSAPSSIHLTTFPKACEDVINADIIEEMEAVRKLTTLALSARESAKIKIRQPLSEVIIESLDPVLRRAAEKFQDLLLETLNIKSLVIKDVGFLKLEYNIQPNYKTLGPKFGSRLGVIISAIGQANPNTLKLELDRSKNVSVIVDNESIVLEANDLIVSILPMPSYSIALDAKATVVVNTTIDDKLAREGLMRDLLRKLQGLRKEMELDISDRIRICYSTSSATLSEVINEWGSYLMEELLCEALEHDTVVHIGKEIEVLGNLIYIKMEKLVLN